MTSTLLMTLERGTLRMGYRTVDFASAVRGLLVKPLLDRGVSPSHVDAIVESVLKREEVGSTSSGPIALPHARISGIPEIIAGLGVNATGIYGDNPARVMLAFVSPMEATAEHLRFLSTSAKTFRDRTFLERVQTATTTDELRELLRATAG
jgi:mannitol/fructose-specific phosphotransferase system IIA component (Ntr-type)